MHKPIFAISYKKPEELQYLPDEDFVWDAIQQHGNTGIDYIDSDITLWNDEAFQWAMNRSFKNSKFDTIPAPFENIKRTKTTVVTISLEDVITYLKNMKDSIEKHVENLNYENYLSWKDTLLYTLLENGTQYVMCEDVYTDTFMYEADLAARLYNKMKKENKAEITITLVRIFDCHI